MTFALVRKILRDLRLPLLAVAVFLLIFQCFWAKITQRITEEILPTLLKDIPLDVLLKILFKGPGKIIETLLGGERINLTQGFDVLTIGYVHPLMQTVFAVWAIGRASGAIAGEIDRGTMELLLAQPIPRSRVILAHLVVDLVTIPVLCLGLWAGNWLGVAVFGEIDWSAPGNVATLRVNPVKLAPALPNVAALIFAVTGTTLWLSSAGRFRGRVMGLAVFLTLVQFLVNVLGQLWDGLAPLRPLTVFYYYQPQQVIQAGKWTVPVGLFGSGPVEVPVLGVLAGVGLAGYGLALWTFRRRDLPAPL